MYLLPRTGNTTPVTGVKYDNSGIGGWNTPTQDLIDAYETDDTRKDASIAVAEGTYNASNVFAISANKSIVNYTLAAGKIGVPYIKKYLNAHPIPITPTTTLAGIPGMPMRCCYWPKQRTCKANLLKPWCR